MPTGDLPSPGAGPGDAKKRRREAPFDVTAWSRPREWPLLITLLMGTVKTAYTRLMDAQDTIDGLRCELIEEIKKNDGLRRLLAQRQPEAMDTLRMRRQLDQEIDLFNVWFRLIQSSARDQQQSNRVLLEQTLQQRRRIDGLLARLADLQTKLGFQDEYNEHWHLVMSELKTIIDEHEEGCDCMSLPSEGSKTPSQTPLRSTASGRLGAVSPAPQEPVQNETIEITEFDPDRQRTALEAKKSAAAQTLNRFRESHHAMSVELQAKRVETSRLSEELAATRDALSKATTENGSLKAANKTLTTENARLRDQVRKLEESLKKHQSGLREADGAIDFFNELLDGLGSETDQDPNNPEKE
jgi:DNA repair exonuclease SbcCD ATPase subunit